MNHTRFYCLTALIVTAATSRLLPHPPNVAPLAALALFAGATFPTRRAATLVPLAVLALSDLLLEATYRAGWQGSWGFYPGQWAVYACCLITAALGRMIRHRRTAPVVATATVASALIFFIVTNFAVWAGGMLYPQTVGGLLLCYEMALPFLRNSLAGDLAYSAALFGALALAEARFPILRPQMSSGRG